MFRTRPRASGPTRVRRRSAHPPGGYSAFLAGSAISPVRLVVVGRFRSGLSLAFMRFNVLLQPARPVSSRAGIRTDADGIPRLGVDRIFIRAVAAVISPSVSLIGSLHSTSFRAFRIPKQLTPNGPPSLCCWRPRIRPAISAPQPEDRVPVPHERLQAPATVTSAHLRRPQPTHASMFDAGNQRKPRSVDLPSSRRCPPNHRSPHVHVGDLSAPAHAVLVLVLIRSSIMNLQLAQRAASAIVLRLGSGLAQPGT